MDNLIGFLVLVTIWEFYILPTIAAWLLRHHQLYAIGVLNLLLGWTLLGWIGALVWAFTTKREEPLLHQKKLAVQNRHRKHKQSTAQSHSNFSIARVQGDCAYGLDDDYTRLARVWRTANDNYRVESAS
jgi:Superinfection immunity protein